MSYAVKRMRGDHVLTPGTADVEDTRAALFARNGRIEGTPVYEPIHDSYRPTASAPLNFSRLEVQGWQDDIEEMLMELLQFELTGQVSDKVMEFVISSVMLRLWQREGTNGSVHARRLYKRPKYSLVDAPRAVVNHACKAANEGTATVAESEMARHVLGASSAEYGNLTIVNDKRAEHLSSLYQETAALLGDGYDPEPYTITIDTFDRDPGEPSNNHIGAMRIKAKRRLGKLANDTVVKERSFVMLDMSQNGPVNQDVVDEIVQASKEEKEREVQQKRAQHELKLDMCDDEALYWLQHREVATGAESVALRLESLPHVEELLREVAEQELCHEAAIARNTTVYGYNKEIDTILHERQHAELQRKLQESSAVRHLLGTIFGRLPHGIHW